MVIIQIIRKLAWRIKIIYIAMGARVRAVLLQSGPPTEKTIGTILFWRKMRPNECRSKCNTVLVDGDFFLNLTVKFISTCLNVIALSE